MKNIYIVLIQLFFLTINLFAQGVTIASGTTFSLGGSTFTLPGNWTNSGTFAAGTGTVIFNGPSGNQTITNPAGENFLNLTVNKASGEVVLNSRVTVTGNLTLTSGDINLDGDTIVLGISALLSETAGNTVKGMSGIIRTTRSLGANSGNVGGLGVNITSSPVLGSTTIERGHRPDSIGGSNSITRNYKITPTNNSGLNATASFYYDHSELNNLTEANLGLYKSTDNGSNWYAAGGTLNTSNNYITAASIGSFSKWSLFSTTNPPTDVEEEEESNGADMPKVYALSQNYPNPFNPSTSIGFDLPKRSHVVIKIYDEIGREIATLVNRDFAPGKYSEIWNASSFPSGVYFYRIYARSDDDQNAQYTSTKKIVLLK